MGTMSGRRLCWLWGVVLAVSTCASEGPLRVRTVTFDNVYGAATSIPVHVKVDGGPEQLLDATCTPSTCSFKLPLSNARHELEVAVEQNGKRSTQSRITVDTTTLP